MSKIPFTRAAKGLEGPVDLTAIDLAKMFCAKVDGGPDVGQAPTPDHNHPSEIDIRKSDRRDLQADYACR